MYGATLAHYQQVAREAQLYAALQAMAAMCDALGIGGAVVNQAKEALNATDTETSARSA